MRNRTRTAAGERRQAIPVTVVTPTWWGDADRAVRLRFLTTATESARTAASVIVVDNASTPPIGEFEAVTANANVTVHRIDERVTVGEARNRGLDLVTTPYVYFLDSDDWLAPGALEHLARILDEDSDAVAAIGAQVLVFPDGRRARLVDWLFASKLWLARTLAPWPRIVGMLECVRGLLPGTNAIMLRTGVAVEAGGYRRTNVGEDAGFVASLLWRGRVAITPEPVHYWRQHADVPRLSGGWSLRDCARISAELRKRLAHDSATPSWIRTALPALRIVHAALSLPCHCMLRWRDRVVLSRARRS